MASELDEFLKTLGSPGRYQIFVSVLLMANLFPLSFHNLNMVFLGATPPHHCKLPNSSWSRNDSIPLVQVDGKAQLDQCHIYKDPTNHSLGTVGCEDRLGWEYLYEGGDWTIVGEWNLVCHRKFMVPLVTTAYFGGTLVGAPIFGLMADKFGRKPIMLAMLFANVIVGFVQFFSSNYIMFTFFKAVHGMLMQGMIASSHNLNIELFHVKDRTESAVATNLIFTIGQVALTGIAYFCRTWRYIYLATSVPSIITISYIWLVPESLRWLMVTNKVEEATRVAKRYVHYNKIDLKDQIDQQVALMCKTLSSKNENSNPNADYRDLFRTPFVRKMTLIGMYLWFAVSLVYYGINFSIPSMAGNKYVNFLIGTCIEICARIAMYPALKKIGRRITNSVAFTSAGILCIASVLIEQYLHNDDMNPKLISTVCALIGKAMSSVAFACVILLTSEVLPTVIRGIALGSCGFANRIGGMLAPQILILGDYTAAPVPLCLLGVAGIVAGGVTLLMPETLKISLPDTIEDAERLGLAQKLNRKARSKSPETHVQNEMQESKFAISNSAFQHEGNQ